MTQWNVTAWVKTPGGRLWNNTPGSTTPEGLKRYTAMYLGILHPDRQQLRTSEIVRDWNVSKLRIAIAVLAISLLSIVRIEPAQAQVQGGWSEPYRLSSDTGKSSEGYLVADQYGYVHCFWTETLFENGRTVIK